MDRYKRLRGDASSTQLSFLFISASSILAGTPLRQTERLSTIEFNLTFDILFFVEDHRHITELNRKKLNEKIQCDAALTRRKRRQTALYFL